MKQPDIVLATDRDPWERQPQESPKRFAQFCAFRDLGRTRTLKKAAEILKLSDGHVYNISAAGLWRPRAAAYDNHLDAMAAAARIEARRRAAEADAVLVDKMRDRIRHALERDADLPLKPGQVAAWTRVVLSARAGLYGPELAAAAGGQLEQPTDPQERRLAGYDFGPDAGDDLATAKLLELRRLDRLQSYLWPAATGGDAVAVRAIERLMAARARLLGLNSATRVEHVQKSELDAELERMLASLPIDLPPAPPEAR